MGVSHDHIVNEPVSFFNGQDRCRWVRSLVWQNLFLPQQSHTGFLILVNDIGQRSGVVVAEDNVNFLSFTHSTHKATDRLDIELRKEVDSIPRGDVAITMMKFGWIRLTFLTMPTSVNSITCLHGQKDGALNNEIIF
jgi:hypothetical protein